jgi:hypothetical protein
VCEIAHPLRPDAHQAANYASKWLKFPNCLLNRKAIRNTSPLIMPLFLALAAGPHN